MVKIVLGTGEDPVGFPKALSSLLHEVSSVKGNGFARLHYLGIFSKFTEVVPGFPLTI